MTKDTSPTIYDLDDTHATTVRSWVASANGHAHFPIQNLPFGVFAVGGGGDRIGVAIGDSVLDVQKALEIGALTGLDAAIAEACGATTLNPLMALPSSSRRTLRRALFKALESGSSHRAELEKHALHASTACTMRMPARVGDYTDFYAGLHHAKAAGELFRPGNPLLPNYKHMPVAYHSRSSTISVDADVHRPVGQRLPAGESTPVVGPTTRMDYELEIGIWVGAPTSGAVSAGAAGEHIFGYGLLNDWSAREFQRWESQPLGPFLAKNFATTVSPWIVTAEALAPFRNQQRPREPGDPKPLSYLMDETDQRHGALAIDLEVLMCSAEMRAAGVAPVRVSLGSSLDLYWTPSQMVAHHTLNGCRLLPGDLLGTGTVSAPDRQGPGCLLEMTLDGAKPMLLGNEERTYLEDGDEIIFRGLCKKEGFATIGLGELHMRVLPALPVPL